MSKQTLGIGLSVLALLGASLYGFALAGIIPVKLTPTDEPLVATQPINEKRSTGGMTKQHAGSDDTDKAQNDTTISNDIDVRPVPPPSSAMPPDQSPATNQAPKQMEIKQSVSTEQEYRALLLPNDPYAQTSWVFTTMKAPSAWDLTTGQPVIVAVIDSGFALAHEDLENVWAVNDNEQGMTQVGDACWTGTSRPKQSNNCDDDNNGYVDDWRGWNFTLIDNNPQTGRDNPDGQAVSHGTQVAGLVGAESNNGLGTASFNWHTKIMPLQALSDEGSGYTSDITAAIYYAVDNGADIINLSLGAAYYDSYVAAATAYAHENNVVVVASAGNCGSGSEYGCDPNKPGAMGYPASNQHVIAVGALNGSNQRASFSSYGPALDVMAPGSGSIISPMWLKTNQTSAYAGTLHGTSFSAPLVSSVAALLRSERPSSTADDVIALINGTADKLPALGNNFFTAEYGHGATDAALALAIALELDSTSNQPTLSQTGSVISEHSFAANSLLSSGCSAAQQTYCTVWARNDEGHDRYWPYRATDGAAGWQWDGTNLDSGEWRLRARSGDYYSATSYYLFRK